MGIPGRPASKLALLATWLHLVTSSAALRGLAAETKPAAITASISERLRLTEWRQGRESFLKVMKFSLLCTRTQRDWDLRGAVARVRGAAKGCNNVLQSGAE